MSNDTYCRLAAADWPKWLVHLSHSLFKGLPESEREQFYVDLRKAIPAGKDLEPVLHRLAVARMDRLIALMQKSDYETRDDVIGVLETVKAGHALEGQHFDWSEAWWSAARSRAMSVANAAMSMANAARSAQLATWPAQAAESVAESVEWAAEAAQAAESVAESVEWAAEAAEAAEWAAVWAATETWSESAAEWAVWAESVTEAAKSAEYRAERDTLFELLKAL